MAYTKRPLRPRVCAHCVDPYQAVDRRRLYCSPRCKTLASNARRRATGAALPLGNTPLAAPVSAEGPTPSLPFDMQTVGVVAVGSTLGNLGLRAVDKLLSSPPPAPSAPVLPVHPVSAAPVREDPAGWFPAAVLAAAAVAIPVQHPQWPTAQLCLPLEYFGRRFYYQPTLRVLFWECAPGQVWPLNRQAEFTRVFELAIPQLGQGATPTQLQTLS